MLAEGAPRETMEGDSAPYHFCLHCADERPPTARDTTSQLMSSRTGRAVTPRASPVFASCACTGQLKFRLGDYGNFLELENLNGLQLLFFSHDVGDILPVKHLLF